MKHFFIILIQFYRKYLSPLKASCCRFSPTCSEYALEAFAKYGTLKGGFLVLKRIVKCNPFCRGGYDPLK